jgi:hypothetical protein
MSRPPARSHCSIFLVLALMLPACKSTTGTADSGIDLPRPGTDQPGRDLLAADRALADTASPTPCLPGQGLSPLALEGSYCVAARFEVGSQAPVAIGLRSGRFYSLLGGGSPFLLEVKEYALPTTGQLGTGTPFFSAVASGAGQIFPADYLALGSTGATAVVGYDLESMEGVIFWGDRGSPPRTISNASGNYRAAFLDDTTLLVNGQGVGAAQQGQGVYLVREGQPARRLIKDLGIYSGHLALTGGVLFAGGYFGDGNKIYAFTQDEVRAAVQSGAQLTPAIDGDLVYAGEVFDATAVTDDLGDSVVLLPMDAAARVTGVKRVTVTVSAKSVTSGGAVEVVTVPAGGALTVEKLGAWQNELGLLVTGGPSAQVAVLRHQP